MKGFKCWIAVTNGITNSESLHKHSAEVCLKGQVSRGLQGPSHFPLWLLKEYERFPSLADVAVSCWASYTTLPSADFPFSLQFRQARSLKKTQQFIFKDLLNIHILFLKSKRKTFPKWIFFLKTVFHISFVIVPWGSRFWELTQEPYIRHMDPKLSYLLEKKNMKSSWLNAAVDCFNILIPSKSFKQPKTSLHSPKLSHVEGLLIALQTSDRVFSCTLR